MPRYSALFSRWTTIKSHAIYRFSDIRNNWSKKERAKRESCPYILATGGRSISAMSPMFSVDSHTSWVDINSAGRRKYLRRISAEEWRHLIAASPFPSNRPAALPMTYRCLWLWTAGIRSIPFSAFRPGTSDEPPAPHSRSPPHPQDQLLVGRRWSPVPLPFGRIIPSWPQAAVRSTSASSNGFLAW